MRDIRIFRGRFPVAAASRRLLTACACVVLALLPAAVTAADPAGVLILYSNQRPTPAQVIIEGVEMGSGLAFCSRAKGKT